MVLPAVRGWRLPRGWRCDRSSHPSDQRKWIAFLLCVYRTQTEVDGDTFGACLKAKGWWPEEHIPALVDEYEFAMRLLGQAEGRIPRMAGRVGCGGMDRRASTDRCQKLARANSACFRLLARAPGASTRY